MEVDVQLFLTNINNNYLRLPEDMYHWELKPPSLYK